VNAIASIVSIDVAVANDDLGSATGSGTDGGWAPTDLARAYDVTPLLRDGWTGQGVTVGVVAGGSFDPADVAAFLKSNGIVREAPTVVQTLEAPSVPFLETTLDVEWTAAMAPAAKVVAYEGPDRSDTALVYTFHEAIARFEAQIVTHSFGEYAPNTAASYDDAALEAAALGITVVASSGDYARANLPSSSSYVTAVGGTVLFGVDGGAWSEEAWKHSGCGATPFPFARPSWQSDQGAGGSRTTADVALVATNASLVFGGKTVYAGGTSLSSPALAGILAVVQSKRAAAGHPSMGWLNAVLYTSPDVQASFHDVVSGCTTNGACAGVGWDEPTGWGSVRATDLAAALP
jgi:kumamolisin